MEVAKTPAAEKYWNSAALFAIGKIVNAYGRALEELGREDVELACGSWRFDFLRAADRFMPEGVKFLPLDYHVLHGKSQMDTVERRAAIARVGARRPVVPVVWAHHDDGNYVGRSYTPYPRFHEKLADAKAAGFGIIHWTTRPLDLYFESLVRQVWAADKNQPLEKTCREVAARWFGPEQADHGLQLLPLQGSGLAFPAHLTAPSSRD